MIGLKNTFAVLFLVCLFSLNGQAQDKKTSWKSLTEKKDGIWFASDEAKEIAENVLLYQRNIGGWPKNIQMQNPVSETEKQQLQTLKTNSEECTTDNGATYQEMHFLAKMFSQTADEKYKKAFLSGLDYLFMAQYKNGGWPQFYPLKKGYYTHITYNDDSMVHILLLLKDVFEGKYFVSNPISTQKMEQAKVAFDNGITCILKSQYEQNGVLTAWCAQHDEFTLAPAKARAYELPSLSGKESAQIVLLLMALENPSKEIIVAVNAAVNWFEKTKIIGLRQDFVYNEKGKITDKKMIPDENAPAIWARFMELNDNAPFFCDRDGVKKANLSEIGSERRNGYSWYTDEPKEVFKKFETWKKKVNSEISVEKKSLIQK